MVPNSILRRNQAPCARACWLLLTLAGLVLAPFGLAAQEAPAPAKPLTAAQKERLKVRNRLWSEALALKKEGKLAEALAAGEQVLLIEREVLGGFHEDVIESLEFLAGLQEIRDEFAPARKARQELIEIRLRVGGADHWKTIDAQLSLAHLNKRATLSADESGELAAAEKHNSDAVALYGQGKYREALSPANKALALRKKVLGEEHRDTATSLYNLGAFLDAQGDFAAARPYYEQALAIRKKVLGEQHPDTATSLNNLGALLWDQNDYAASRPYHEQALAIRKKALGEQHPDTATSLNNLGALFRAQGDYAAARPYYEQALAIRKKVLGEQHPDLAQSLNNLGALLQAQGDYAPARPYYEQALAIYKKALGEQHPATVPSLNNLGALLLAQSDYAGARPYYEQALAIRKKVLGEQHPDTALSLNNLGDLLRTQEDYAGARPYFEQALAIRKKVLGEQHRNTATSLNDMGFLLWAQGDFAAARPYYEQALAIYKKVLGEQHPDTAPLLNNLSVLLRSQEDFAAARPYCEQALGITRKNVDLAALAQSERQQLTMNRDRRHRLDSFLSLMATSKASPPEIYAQLLPWKGVILVRQRQLREVRADPKLAPLAEKLRIKAAQLAQLAFAVPDPKKANEHHDKMGKLTEEKEDLETALARASEGFRKGQEQVQLTPEQLAKSLPAGAALVDFLEYEHSSLDLKKKGKIVGERRLLAFIVRPDRPVHMVELGDMGPIETAIDQWRTSVLRRMQPLGSAKDPARILRERLWQPLEERLMGFKTVLIAPDGALGRLPFAALPGKEPGKYLVEEIALAVAPVPQLLPALLENGKEPESVAATLLLVGDVDYGGEPGKTVVSTLQAPRSALPGGFKEWTKLDGTRGEILAIQDSFERRFPKGKVLRLREDAATEASFREEAPKHRWLHLATHGFFAPEELKSALGPRSNDKASPAGLAGIDMFGGQGISGFHPGLLSGLVLAGANRKIEIGQDDGIMTALEVQELDLRKVELAVLSACETGLGKTAGGEGLLGLQRSFQVAGAKSVVSSLWKVEDEATRKLMERFYDNMWRKNMTKLQALQDAQLWMLREGVKRGLVRLDQEQGANACVPPYYWAAFVLSGDWR